MASSHTRAVIVGSIGTVPGHCQGEMTCEKPWSSLYLRNPRSSGNRREPGVADEKILIVDPDQAARRRLAKVLRQRGLQPVEASGGEEALKELAKDEYAVVFLDLGGAGPRGVEVVGRMIERKPEQA